LRQNAPAEGHLTFPFRRRVIREMTMLFSGLALPIGLASYISAAGHHPWHA